MRRRSELFPYLRASMFTDADASTLVKSQMAYFAAGEFILLGWMIDLSECKVQKAAEEGTPSGAGGAEASQEGVAADAV